MVGKDYPLLYEEKDFLSTIENMLDNPSLRQEAKDYLLPKLPDFKWGGRVVDWFNGWKFLDELPYISETDSYKKIVNFIREKKSVSKFDILCLLNWGIRVKWSSYRNRLRNEKDIRFTKNRYEVIEK